MKKYSHFLKISKNGVLLKNQYQWPDIVKFFKEKLDVDTCELHVYHDANDFIKKLKNPPIKQTASGYTINDGVKYNDLDLTLDIDTYLDYINKYDDGFLYFGNNENPNLYKKERLIVSTISHEKYIEFYVNEDERKIIENGLKISLKEKAKN